ncbi:hypothetical protein [Endothiovibrio diazotrophicus]
MSDEQFSTPPDPDRPAPQREPIGLFAEGFLPAEIDRDDLFHYALQRVRHAIAVSDLLNFTGWGQEQIDGRLANATGELLFELLNDTDTALREYQRRHP